MKQNLNLKFNNSSVELEKFKKYIKTHECPIVNIDLSSLNIFEAAKFISLSSVYHYQKYPNGKLNYSVASNDIKSLVCNLFMNFELTKI